MDKKSVGIIVILLVIGAAVVYFLFTKKGTQVTDEVAGEIERITWGGNLTFAEFKQLFKSKADVKPDLSGELSGSAFIKSKATPSLNAAELKAHADPRPQNSIAWRIKNSSDNNISKS